MTEKEIDIALEWLNDLEDEIEDIQFSDDETEYLEKLRIRRDFLNNILVKGTENYEQI